jgi:autotransporter-associated beta strand protein
MKCHILSCSMVLTLWLGALSAVYADSATWTMNPMSGDWNTAANWTPNTVPNGPNDTATFAISNSPTIRLSAATDVKEIVFASGAGAFSITATTQAGLTFSGAGVINDSGTTQNFVTTAFAGDSSIGVITFSGRSSAGSGTVFTNHNGPSVVVDVGTTTFRDQSSAGNATFNNLGGTASGRAGGETNFYGGSAGESTIVVNGAEAVHASGGRVYVGAGSSLENATLTVNGDPGLEGGNITFDSESSGGMVAVALFGSGNMDISLAAFDPEIAVGSIEGDGRIGLGSSTLNVGSNNRRTTFDGLIADGPFIENYGGHLRKSGLEELTLTHANTYTGSTVVMSGVLTVANETGSATGKGPVQVNGGTLSGTGTIAGAVTIGTGTDSGAILDPGDDSIPGTLTIQNHLILHADATCTILINSDTLASDQLTAKGIRIRDASVLFQDIGTTLLPAGTTFTVITNTAATRIKGTFANLPDGSIITIGSNNFQASYEGSDGNDLTLTVIP